MNQELLSCHRHQVLNISRALCSFYAGFWLVIGFDCGEANLSRSRNDLMRKNFASTS